MSDTVAAAPEVQSPTLSTALRERIQTELRDHPGRMTLQLAAEYSVPEVEIVRLMPAGRATEFDATRWEELIRSFEGLGSLHVIVTSGAATLEATGEFGGFSTWNEFFNVQTETLDMHIRWPNIGAIIAVEKPSHMNGVATLSLQFFDRAGHSAFKVFLNFGGKANPQRAARFAELRQSFAAPSGRG